HAKKIAPDPAEHSQPAEGGGLSPKHRALQEQRARFAPRRFRSLLGIVENLPRDASILDFGCGNGRNTYALLDLGYSNVTGYDIRDYLQLRSPMDRRRFRIGLRPDGTLPFDDDTFDLVISDQVFEHVLDQVGVFRELHRITK